MYEEQPPLLTVNGGISELFYVLDFGDWLGSIFERVLTSNMAAASGHLVCFGVNGALWAVYIAFVAKCIAWAIS